MSDEMYILPEKNERRIQAVPWGSRRNPTSSCFGRISFRSDFLNWVNDLLQVAIGLHIQIQQNFQNSNLFPIKNQRCRGSISRLITFAMPSHLILSHSVRQPFFHHLQLHSQIIKSNHSSHQKLRLHSSGNVFLLRQKVQTRKIEISTTSPTTTHIIPLSPSSLYPMSSQCPHIEPNFGNSHPYPPTYPPYQPPHPFQTSKVTRHFRISTKATATSPLVMETSFENSLDPMLNMWGYGFPNQYANWRSWEPHYGHIGNKADHDYAYSASAAHETVRAALYSTKSTLCNLSPQSSIRRNRRRSRSQIRRITN